jgi:hypothetical protein
MIDDTKAPEQEWLCDQQVLSIYYFQTPTIEAAARMYHQMINSPVQAPGKPVASPKFGDESSITIGGYSTDSYVFFRRGSIVVRIDSSSLQKIEAARTLKSAIMFAQIVDKEIAAAK